MPTVQRLSRTAYGMHFADQIALVCVPLIAALVFDASAAVIGVLVACQSMAHLLGSIPFGMLVDRAQQRTLVIVAACVSLVGFGGAGLAVLAKTLIGFGFAVTFAGFGVVLFTLTALSILPKAVAAPDLAGANARIELPRAICSFAVPLGVGLVISGASAVWVFPVAAAGAFGAVLVTFGLPRFEVTVPDGRQSALGRIVEGGRFVVRHNLLRAISICAIFWNAAFSALLVTMVPLIRQWDGLDAGVFGIALAAFGLGAIGGTWASRRFAGRIVPKVALVFGPASSLVAALMLLIGGGVGGVPLICLAFFLLGFGPSIWLIAQNSVRQMVSPPAMLGRVNAVIQTTIYGVRPLAALVAGAVVGATSPQTGLLMVVGGFALSFGAAGWSGLRRITSYAELRVGAEV